MDKRYKPQDIEQKIYAEWEKHSCFTPIIDKNKKPFTIMLPLPNANDPMHMGHALFTVQDIMIRYHRMCGDPTLWLPGGDHAGIETQYVFEKHLKKRGNSRFDYDRNTLYKMIADFVEQNKDINRSQMKRLGFSLDWSRYAYSLDPNIVNIVMQTFKELHEDGLIYRTERLVNYCTTCGTSFSDLEIKHEERTDPLYYMKYGPFVIATVRPETKFGDTAVAVHPKDTRYKQWIGKYINVIGLNGPFKVQVIEDNAIDPAFGTGVAKVTPAHDMTDFEIGKRHNLKLKQVITLEGKLNNLTGPYEGLRVNKARKRIAEDLEKKNLLEKIDHTYSHTVSVCYKCNTVIEPLPLPQWYIKVQPLAKKAITAVKQKKTNIIPKKRFEKMYFDWLENIEDWNISRQIVWGPQIPAWYCLDCNKDIIISFITKKKKHIQGKASKLLQTYSFKEIETGIQTLIAPVSATYEIDLTEKICKTCGSKRMLQETDTFDTWFLSGQWPYSTLMSRSKNTKKHAQNSKHNENISDFEYFYPTSVLDTLWDILFFWVARMMMLGIYKTGSAPFETIHIHSRVVDKHGKKMSKSKGNVIDPIHMVDQFGADALRMALIYGVAPGSDISLSEDKIRGMRNFANKLWNIARFIHIYIKQTEFTTKHLYTTTLHTRLTHKEDKRIISETHMLVAHVTKNITKYRFSDAAQELYDFLWHRVADIYLEGAKKRLAQNNKQTLAVLLYVFKTCIKLLHPFMPFVTEYLWSTFPKHTNERDLLIVSDWPCLKRHTNT